MKIKQLLFLMMVICFIDSINAYTQTDNSQSSVDLLVVLWTSDDPYVAERVALMYTHAAKTNHWFSNVVLVIWGPSAKLLTTDMKLQEKVKSMQKDGIVTEACIACSNMYGVTEDLENLGITVKGMGQPLSVYLKNGAKVLTF